MIERRIVTTAYGSPEGLAKEIARALLNYNNQVTESQKVVFLEINEDYYKGTVTRDSSGKLTGYHKLTLGKMKAILTSAAAWRTQHRYSSFEGGWMAKNGGGCPRYVAEFAAYNLQPKDLPEIEVIRIGGRGT